MDKEEKQNIKLEKVDDKTAYENLLIKYAELENKIADIKANCDYILEGKDLEIKTLGEHCNQLLKDKGELTDRVSNQAESLRIIMLEEEKKYKQIEELEKENAELKEKLNFSTQYYQGEKAKEQLTKAKEIIREIMKYDIPTLDYEKAEQFLKEIEK